MDDDWLLTKAELAELLAGRRPDAPVTPAGTVPDWVNKQRMLKSKGSKRLTQARIEELNSIDGWLWDARKND